MQMAFLYNFSLEVRAITVNYPREHTSFYGCLAVIFCQGVLFSEEEMDIFFPVGYPIYCMLLLK